jgi:hypothetical protein
VAFFLCYTLRSSYIGGLSVSLKFVTRSEPRPESKEKIMEKITASLRVTTLKVQSFAYKDGIGEMAGGESLEMRASGFWVEEKTNDHFPISLHLTVYPGHGVVPEIGDNVVVSVSR